MADDNVGIYLRSQGISAGGETPGAGIFLDPQGGLDVPSFSNWFSALQAPDQSAIAAAIANLGNPAGSGIDTAPVPSGVTPSAATPTDPAAAVVQNATGNAGSNLPGVPGSTVNTATGDSTTGTQVALGNNAPAPAATPAAAAPQALGIPQIAGGEQPGSPPVPNTLTPDQLAYVMQNMRVNIAGTGLGGGVGVM